MSLGKKKNSLMPKTIQCVADGFMLPYTCHKYHGPYSKRDFCVLLDLFSSPKWTNCICQPSESLLLLCNISIHLAQKTQKRELTSRLKEVLVTGCQMEPKN